MGTAVQVLSILDAPVVTGPARGLIHLARHLPSEVHLNVAILRGRGAGAIPRLDEIARGRMTVFEIQERGAFDPWILRRALEIARTVRADIVQSHSYKPHLIAMFLRAVQRVPWVGHHHGWTAENTKVKLYHRIDAMSLPRAERVVAVSESARDIVKSEGVRPERIVLIPNAVDLEDLQTEHTMASARKKFDLPDDRVIACTVGRLSHEKGQDVLLRAVGKLKDTLPSLLVALVGDGPDRAMLEALAKELGIGAMVRFLGHQRDVATVYRASDFMVMPSRSEAMPNVLLESMTLGVPVVATRVGGVPEVAQDGTDAWIVPSDAPDAMADAIFACASDTTERARRAQRARAVVQAQHDPRCRARRYVQMYEELLGRAIVTASMTSASAEGIRGGRLEEPVDARSLAKLVVRAVARGTVTPLVVAYQLETALLPTDRRDPVFQVYSQVLSMVPGYTGQALRRAFYGAVLVECHPDSCIQWATVLSSPEVSIGKGVYIGARCMVGRALLEAHVTIGSNVDILSGKNQHSFDDPTKPVQDQGGRFEHVRVGTNTWIGNGAVVLANVGARSVVAAGAVVVSDVPDDVIVGGNPARVLKRRDPDTRQWVRAG